MSAIEVVGFTAPAKGPVRSAVQRACTVVVTISNLYGCGALGIAQRVASELGYEYVDEQLPIVVARRLQTTASAVESVEDAQPGVGERMLRTLELGTPEVGAGSEVPTFDQACLREVQEAVREYAAHGNVVIVGRGAHAILGANADVLRVFIQAPRDWRIGRIAEQHRIDPRLAAAETDRIDRARAAYIRMYYGFEWRDPSHYDLIVDACAFGDSAAALIAAAVRMR